MTPIFQVNDRIRLANPPQDVPLAGMVTEVQNHGTEAEPHWFYVIQWDVLRVAEEFLVPE